MDWSLNTAIIETLADGLGQEKSQPERQRSRVLRIMREHSLVENPGPAWKKYTENAPQITHAELRAKLQGIPPLSEMIIEEREPR
jgi:hypothetical protein